MNLFETGVYLRKPGGNVENVAEQKAAGVKWALLNMGVDVGRDPTVWNNQRQVYKDLPHGPWMHCRSMADIDFVLSIARVWGSPLVGVNVEDVVADGLSLEAVGRVLRASGLPVHMATLPWVQNEQGWSHVDFCTLALEMFPLEGQGQVYLDQWEKCVDHAFAEGAKKVTLLFSTTSPRSKYPNVAHCLYTADNVTDWSAWTDGVPQPVPVPPRPEVPKVPLTPNQKKEFRAELVAYAKMAEAYEHRWTYSQHRPFGGYSAAPQTFHRADCSAYCSLAFYWAMKHTGVVVSDPLGFKYSGYGNTQSAIEYLDDHRAPRDKYRVGDMAIFGSRGDTVHMMFCRKSGTGTTAMWSSFGQESGPEGRSPVNYHPSPLVGVYRHPALL